MVHGGHIHYSTLMLRQKKNRLHGNADGKEKSFRFYRDGNPCLYSNKGERKMSNINTLFEIVVKGAIELQMDVSVSVRQTPYAWLKGAEFDALEGKKITNIEPSRTEDGILEGYFIEGDSPVAGFKVKCYKLPNELLEEEKEFMVKHFKEVA